MSREIKFRVWDKEEKKMILSKNVTDSINIFARGCLSSNIELMQYTGVKDKNGTEIYEGDIVEFNDVEYSDSPSQKFTIRSGEDFHRDCCYLQNINEYIDQYIKDNGEYPDDSIEIVGNIYENPKLIKECEW